MIKHFVNLGRDRLACKSKGLLLVLFRRSGVRFESAAYAVEAAVQGEGVLLGRSALVSADLAAGRLVRPFDLSLKSRWSYYVVDPQGALRHRKVRAFRDWLFSEMANG